MDYSPWGCEELEKMERLTTHGHGGYRGFIKDKSGMLTLRLYPQRLMEGGYLQYSIT